MSNFQPTSPPPHSKIKSNAYNIYLPTKLRKKKGNKDDVRYQITNFMTTNNLGIRHKKHRHFHDYLGREDFLAEIYLILCCGFYDTKQSIACIKKIVEYFDRERDTITFKELFQIEPDWIPYFAENAHPDGTLKPTEHRKGVCKTRCTDIMKIKNLLISNKSLDTAIALYDFINLKTFLGPSDQSLTTFD